MRRPGSSWTRRATARASSGVSAPDRCMPVSTSTRTPIVEPASTAAADRPSASPGVVDVDEHVGLAGQERGRPPLLGRHELVRDEDVVGARPDHDDRLPDGGGAQAERAVLELQPGDVRALVVLHVAAEPGVEAGQAGLHVREVRAQDVAVHDERGRDDVVPARARWPTRTGRGRGRGPRVISGAGSRIAGAPCRAGVSPRARACRAASATRVPRGMTGQTSHHAAALDDVVRLEVADRERRVVARDLDRVADPQGARRVGEEDRVLLVEPVTSEVRGGEHAVRRRPRSCCPASRTIRSDRRLITVASTGDGPAEPRRRARGGGRPSSRTSRAGSR